LFKEQPGADPDTYGLGLHSGGGEDIFDKNPEPSYKTSELMNREHVTKAVQERRPGARSATVNYWVQGVKPHGIQKGGRSIPGTIAGWKKRTGGPKREFPKAVSPEEWGSGRHGLWVRSEVEGWMDDAGVGTGVGGTGDAHWKQPKADALLASRGHVNEQQKKPEDRRKRGPKPGTNRGPRGDS
jgi:hypothetical protein